MTTRGGNVSTHRILQITKTTQPAKMCTDDSFKRLPLKGAFGLIVEQTAFLVTLVLLLVPDVFANHRFIQPHGTYAISA